MSTPEMQAWADEAQRLQAENTRLREALEKIVVLTQPTELAYEFARIALSQPSGE